MIGKVIILFGLLTIALPINAFAQTNIYNETNWFDVFGYLIWNPFMAFQLIADKANTDQVYDNFVNLHNKWVDDGKRVPINQVNDLMIKANNLVATKEYCGSFSSSQIRDMIQTPEPYDMLQELCDIPNELDSYIRERLS